MLRFEDLDLLMTDEMFTEEEKLARDTARRWVSERVMPNIEEWAWECRFPVHLVKEMGELGFLGASYKGYGMAEMSAVAYGLVARELEWADSALRSFVSVQSGLVIFPILQWGSSEQKERWLPKLVKGEAIGCYGLTEPDFGSNPGAMRTTAKRTSSGWLLNGEKAWITNGSIADVAVVWARTDEGIRGFLVERGTPGFSTVDHKGKYSLRASVTSQLVFQDCELPEDSILPGTTGLKNPLSCLTEARYGIAWGAVGSAMAVFEVARDYALGRIQFGGKPIASHQIQQEKLVFMFNEITKAQLLALRLGRLKDQGRASHRAVSLAKRNNVWVARECAKLAREMLGAAGIVNEYPIMRHLMNMESVYTYEGTHDIHTLVVGEHITGIRSFAPPGEQM